MAKKDIILTIATLANKKVSNSIIARAMKQTKEQCVKALELAQTSEKDARFALTCLTGILYQ